MELHLSQPLPRSRRNFFDALLHSLIKRDIEALEHLLQLLIIYELIIIEIEPQKQLDKAGVELVIGPLLKLGQFLKVDELR